MYQFGAFDVYTLYTARKERSLIIKQVIDKMADIGIEGKEKVGILEKFATCRVIRTLNLLKRLIKASADW